MQPLAQMSIVNNSVLFIASQVMLVRLLGKSLSPNIGTPRVLRASETIKMQRKFMNIPVSTCNTQAKRGPHYCLSIIQYGMYHLWISLKLT